MNRIRTAVALSVAGGVVAAGVGMVGGAQADETGALEVTGLTAGGALVTFTTENTRPSGAQRPVTGLSGDTRLVGIDYRVQDGGLYGVGDQGGIYLIADSGAATKVRQLTIALEGTQFGVDFNPAANALRITSDTGQNLRQPFATPTAATVADTPLSYPAAGTTPAAGATGVSAAAYTNNDLDAATATTLFDGDSSRDQLVIQSPANSGLLAPTGSFGFNASSVGDLDVYSTLEGGRTVDNDAFGVARDGSNPRNATAAFFAVDLLTGQVQQVGTVGSVVDIALPLDQG